MPVAVVRSRTRPALSEPYQDEEKENEKEKENENEKEQQDNNNASNGNIITSITLEYAVRNGSRACGPYPVAAE